MSLQICFLLALPGRGESIIYPADSGVLNVKSAPYNAYGDGIHDDTAAVQSALAAGLNNHAVVYLPNGTYLVSDTLKWNNGSTTGDPWGRFLSLQGQSQAATIIKLKNNATGYGDDLNPKAVVMTASGDDANQYNHANGEGNQAFENHIRNLTVDVGSGNPGATGIDYQVSNWGALRDVTVKSSDPNHAGANGIAMKRRDNGPGLIKNVTVDGFQYGIAGSSEIEAMTLENITLRNQTIVGVWENGAVFAIRKLTSVNTVPAIQVYGNGLLNLLDSSLTGGTSANAAITTVDGESRCFVRNVTTSGYGSAINNRGTSISGANVTEYVSDPILSVFSTTQKSLNLPIRDTPAYFDSTLSNWRSVGPSNGTDDTAAIQAAMNSGKSTIYFPAGGYTITGTISVPSSVKLVLGMGTTIGTGSATLTGALFRISGGSVSNQTIFDRLTLYPGSNLEFEDASSRTLVLRDLGGSINSGGSVYRNQSGSGALYIEDVSGAGYNFNYPQTVWGRQWNAEGPISPKIYNKGATIWALGFKTEGGDVVIDTEHGGRTEVWGGFLYTFGVSASTPAFINNSSAISVSFIGTTYVPKGFYSLLIQETHGLSIRKFSSGSAYSRGGGVSVPLYVGYSAAQKHSNLPKHTVGLKRPVHRHSI